MELADFLSCCTTIVPFFYFLQVDIAIVFKAKPFKESLKSLTAYALIFGGDVSHQHPRPRRPQHTIIL
jgi:hypothetical protein